MAILTVTEAATQCGKPEITIYKACQSGRLCASRFGNAWLITPEALDTWLTASNTTPGPACKSCKGTDTVKRGVVRGKQRYWCKVCRVTFGI